jgi:hypothetical protein
MSKSAVKIALTAAALAAFAPGIARAADSRGAGPRPPDVQAADVQVRIPAAAVASLPHEALRRAEIFRILQGGTAVTDAALAEHLWVVAGSLARTGWTPPRVTVQVVVKEPDARD